MIVKLIGISGRKRAGKDTLASYLVADGFTRIGFADPLKEIAADLDPIVSMHYDGLRISNYLHAGGWEYAKHNPEVRRTLQLLGTSVREHIAADVWVEAALRRAHQVFLHGGRVVIPDVRFPNEAAAIRKWGGIVVRINRPGTADGTSETDLHVSETAMDGYDFDQVITNDGSVELLRAWAYGLTGAEVTS